MSDRVEPANDAAVLGSSKATESAAVLGGVAGFKQRLADAPIEDRLRAIAEATQYGDAGLALLLPLLEHDSVRLAAAAYDVLREAASPDLQNELVAHVPYEVFECLHKLPLPITAQRHSFVSPDSHNLILVFWDGTIQAFDLHTGAQLSNVQSEWNTEEQLLAAALSPDGTIVYVGGSRGSFRAIELATGRVVRSFATQIPAFHSLAISAGGRILVASVSQVYGHYFEVWDVQTGERLQTCQETATIVQIAISPDAQRVVINAGGTLKIWDWQQNQCLHAIPGGSSASLSFKITPKKQAIVAFHRNIYSAFDLYSGECRGSLTFPERISPHPLTLAPDGKTLVFIDSGYAIWWDICTAKVRRKVSFGQGGIFSPNGQFFMTKINGETEIWGVRSRPIQQPPLTINDSLDEYVYLCSCRRHADWQMSITYPTEEALVRNFLKGGARNGYQFTVEDIRRRVVFKEGGNHYYYELGTRRAAHDAEHAQPLPPLQMDRPDIDEYRAVMPYPPELFPF